MHKVRSTPDDPGRALVSGIVELCDAGGVEPGRPRRRAPRHDRRHQRRARAPRRADRHGHDRGHARRRAHRTPPAARSRTRCMQDIPWQARAVRASARTACRCPSGSRRRRARSSTPLDEDAVRAAGARRCARPGVEAIAVCFLFSYLNPAHEERAARDPARGAAGLLRHHRADISPQFREFERFTTACMNAFVGPAPALPRAPGRRRWRREGVACRPARDALQRRRGQRRRGRRAAGDADAVRARRRRARGAVGRRRWSGAQAPDHLRHGRHQRRHRPRHRGRRQRGLGARHRRSPATRSWCRCSTSRRSAPAAARSPASTTAGAFKVGPRSAGAVPGPACYGRGGDEPTITDAHLVLGRLDPERFLGGEMTLDAGARPSAVVDAARRASSAWRRREAAAGVLTVANANMAQTIRSITVERGRDPRDFSAGRLRRRGPAARGRAGRRARRRRGA